MMHEAQTNQIIELARRTGVVRAADLAAIGASRTLLAYLTDKGVMRRIACGAYVLAEHVPENETFVEIAAAVPHGVVCLLSALQYHEITTQMPSEAWVAIERGRHAPRSDRLPLRIVSFSGTAFSEGIEEHVSDGTTIRVYSAAKTVADCFKFRNRIGLDVAREALVDSLDQKKATRDDLWHFAKICRMTRIMRPYLEMV